MAVALEQENVDLLQRMASVRSWIENSDLCRCRPDWDEACAACTAHASLTPPIVAEADLRSDLLAALVASDPWADPQTDAEVPV